MSNLNELFRQISIESEKTYMVSNKNYDGTIRENNKKIEIPYEIMSKQELLKQTLNHNFTPYNQMENFKFLATINKNSLYSTPFPKINPLIQKTNKLNINESNESESPTNFNNKKARLLTNKDIQNLDLIYDHVLGCYYDPNTEIYYELKEK